MDATTVKTKEQTIVEKKLAEEQKQAALAKSKAKKAKMLAMDTKRAEKVQPTEWQKDEAAKNNNLRSKAQKRMDDDLDDVKHMN